MTTKITPREWEALSAYLDGQLSPKERHRLEARLRESPDLRTTLEELRRTRVLLRSQPRLRAPRNFSLTPEMAGIRTGPRMLSGAYPALRLASVLATIFFIVVFIGDLLLASRQPTSILVAQSVQSEVMPPALVPGVGGGAGEDEGEIPEEAVEAAKEVSVVKEGEAPQPTMAALEAKAPESAGDIGEVERSITPLVGSEAVSPAPAEEAESEPSLAYPEPEMFVPPEGTPMPEQALVPETHPTPALVGRPSGVLDWSILRVLQVTLAILAIGTGLAALFLRRSASG